MINQQILDYIKQQIQQGVSREQIKNSLLTNGWQAQDIEEGFNNIDVSNISTGYSATPVVTSGGAWKIIVGIVIGVAVLGSGAYFVSQTILKPEEVPKIYNEVVSQSLTEIPSEIVTPQQPSEQPTSQTQSQNTEIVFADKLNSCTKYKTTFKHSLTGKTLEKEILGIVNGRCDYVEQMPNNGKMECKYSESERTVVAQYYKDVATAESMGTSVNANLGSGEQKTTYTINGKVVDNPLQEAMNSGVCIISSY